MTLSESLPAAPEVEEAIIGTLLSYPDSISDIVSILTPEMFTRSELARTYQICLEIVRGGGIVDLIVVSQSLRKAGYSPDTIMLITELTGQIMSSANIERHAQIVKEKYLLRKYIKIGTDMVTAAYEHDIDAVCEKVENDLLAMSGQLQAREPLQLGPLIDDVILSIQKVKNKEISLIGVPSGFTTLDRITGGFQKGDLVIIAGRPGMGKTALAVQGAKNAAEMGYPVLIFSCEMSTTELVRRYLSNVSGYTNVQLMAGECDIDRLVTTSSDLMELGIFIDDTSAISLLSIRAKTRRMILKHKIQMIVVDYMQLMTGIGQNREQEISYISRGLKSIAKDLGIPVIALSQLNRGPEGRADKKPQLSDLRESGAIEQDADKVLMAFRPAYYDKTATDNILTLDLVKNRNGACGEIDLKHNISLTAIYED